MDWIHRNFYTGASHLSDRLYPPVSLLTPSNRQCKYRAARLSGNSDEKYPSISNIEVLISGNRCEDISLSYAHRCIQGFSLLWLNSLQVLFREHPYMLRNTARVHYLPRFHIRERYWDDWKILT